MLHILKNIKDGYHVRTVEGSHDRNLVHLHFEFTHFHPFLVQNLDGDFLFLSLGYALNYLTERSLAKHFLSKSVFIRNIAPLFALRQPCYLDPVVSLFFELKVDRAFEIMPDLKQHCIMRDTFAELRLGVWGGHKCPNETVLEDELTSL